VPSIYLQTQINAPVERCFDLSRSIDLHMISTSYSEEKAVEGVTSGLIGQGETVTWEAKHFGIIQRLSSKITRFERPFMFTDEMLKGAFKMIKHDHIFNREGRYTIMTDSFIFESPYGIAGKIFNFLILERYLKNLLIKRNRLIKECAESEKWRQILHKQ
jgi:ligand-binding SRPBCC domain-containing protein